MHRLHIWSRVTALALAAMIVMVVPMAGPPAHAKEPLEAGPGAVQISAGSYHTCALLEGGTVHCWGATDSGRSDDRTAANALVTNARSPDPCLPVNLVRFDCRWTQVYNLSTEWLEGAVQVAAGGAHTCALYASQNVECWGSNFVGASEDHVTRQAVQVAAGSGSTCVLLQDRNVSCWGDAGGADNYMGADATQVDVGDRFSCALLEDGDVHCWGLNFAGQAKDQALGDAVQISTGGYHACALRETGNVHCWGLDDHGQARGYLGGDATEVQAGRDHTCALRENGRITCWGSNARGQSEEPLLADAIGVAAGAEHTCVLRESGRVLCWGANDWDQAADYPRRSSLLCPEHAHPSYCVSRGEQVAQLGIQLVPGDHEVAGYVDRYRFGQVVDVPCVVLVTDGVERNPCAEAGGVFQNRMWTLTRSSNDPSPASANTARICEATLEARWLDRDLPPQPVLTTC